MLNNNYVPKTGYAGLWSGSYKTQTWVNFGRAVDESKSLIGWQDWYLLKNCKILLHFRPFV